MNGTVGAEALIGTKKNQPFMEYTGASKRKSSWPNNYYYWHGLCSTDCGQDESC